MTRTTAADRPASGPLLAVGALVLAAFVAAAAVRLSGVPVRAPDAPAVATRLLHFADRPDGSIAVTDARSGAALAPLRGEQGFIRGALRALARERRMRDIGASAPFELTARADGRLTLADPSTGARLDLESFGPSNAAVFARLMPSAQEN